jgi:glycosyltransferase involved in cell wall biosynthesis
VHVPLPLDKTLFDPDRWDFDIVFGQTTSLLIEFGLWLRKMKGVPLLCVNTTHLPAAYEVLLPDWVARIPGVRQTVSNCLVGPFEQLFRNIYNESDGLVVLSQGLKDYWLSRGVRVPIHVIPRAVSSDVFDTAMGDDPYVAWLESAELPRRSRRLICAGRHTREKEQDRVIRVFAKQVLPQSPDAVLFMVGAGPDSRAYRNLAAELGAGQRIVFTGEVPFQEMPKYYRHADLFLHASRSETFGNVLGEALWSGTAVVAVADGMGASAQVQNRVNGALIENTSNDEQLDTRFGDAVISLLNDALTRRRFGREAARIARLRSSPEVVERLTAQTFEAAQRHARVTMPVPAIQRSRWVQLATTAKHAHRWALVMSGVYITGQFRPHKASLGKSLHPSFSL